ncbi:hypothetical protein [uncultured Amnibacterium sp.]|uniref:hypothetical protein n=1 Tax=uncultured Amnibacterium sp. TaxID=1631851 RepID=UPI0035CC1328
MVALLQISAHLRAFFFLRAGGRARGRRTGCGPADFERVDAAVQQARRGGRVPQASEQASCIADQECDVVIPQYAHAQYM